jgi:hypothetical protein
LNKRRVGNHARKSIFEYKRVLLAVLFSLTISHSQDHFGLPIEFLEDYIEGEIRVYYLTEVDTNLVIKEQYNIWETSITNQFINSIGLWTKPDNFTFTKSYIWERRNNLEGYEFVAETTICRIQSQ